MVCLTCLLTVNQILADKFSNQNLLNLDVVPKYFIEQKSLGLFNIYIEVSNEDLE